MRLFYKEPIYELTPLDEMSWVPVICKIGTSFKLAEPFPILLDPTRRLENIQNFKSLGRDQIEMFHMTFVRRDMISKVRNVSNRANYMDVDGFLKKFEEWTPGDQLAN